MIRLLTWRYCLLLTNSIDTFEIILNSMSGVIFISSIFFPSTSFSKYDHYFHVRLGSVTSRTSNWCYFAKWMSQCNYQKLNLSSYYDHQCRKDRNRKKSGRLVMLEVCRKLSEDMTFFWRIFITVQVRLDNIIQDIRTKW